MEVSCLYCFCFFLKEEGIKVEDVDKENERVINIDVCVQKNFLVVVEYIDDIFNFYNKFEVSLMFINKKFVVFKFKYQ